LYLRWELGDRLKLAGVSDHDRTLGAVSGVALTESLYCTGNNPAPTDAGTLDTVGSVTASEQFTDLEEQG
jgi:hypothetical protein